MAHQMSIVYLTIILMVQPHLGHSYISSPLTSSSGSSSSSLDQNDHYLPDVFLRELVDRLGKDTLSEPSDSYLDPLVEFPTSSRLALIARASKDLENEQFDYDALLDGNPSPSLRDQEYLQHSTLWGKQYISGGGGELPNVGKHQIKTDAGLPAYCNPPNPCPVGFTADQGCLENFENTAAYSREYQAAQDCMCDGEHMFGCNEPSQKEDQEEVNENGDLESFLAQQFHHSAGGSSSSSNSQKNILAKKSSYDSNPFLQGERLPIAAKKGINVY